MKIGLAIPEQVIGFDPAVLRDYVILAEELGFSYVTLVDHVLGTSQADRDPPFPPGGIYTENSIFHEPMTLFAYLSAVTRSLEFVTAVMVLPQRQTALLAKQAAEIALLSGYRLRLGVGTGWNHIEYESLGIDYRTRGARFEEQVGVLRTLWSEPLADLDLPFHRIERASINPRLERPVPLWFGGFSAVQQDRCARIGDGMLWTNNTSLARRGNEAIHEKAIALGRDPKTIGFQCTVGVTETETLHAAIASWGRAGGTHATVSPLHMGGVLGAGELRGRALVDVLPRVREEVGDFI